MSQKSRRIRRALVSAALVAAAIMPAACGTDSSSGDNTGTSAAGLTEAFKTNCAGCHGSGGAGGSGPSLLAYTRNKAAYTAQVRNGGGGMPAFTATQYTDDNITIDFTYLISH
jgi:mono/diheme cytochrome c family protein